MNNNNSIIAKIKVFILAIIFFNTTYCVSQKNKPEPELKSLQLVSSIPMLTAAGKIIELGDTLIVFFYDKYRLLKIPALHSFSKTTINREGDIINQSLIKIEKSYYYFAFKRGDIYGLKFDSLNQNTGSKILVDSFLAEKWADQSHKYLYDTKSDTLVESIKDLKNGFLIEKYMPKVKTDPTYNDSTYLYFTSAIKDLDFSFSNELDSLKKMKLFKVRLIYNANPLGRDLYERSAKEIFLELKEVPVDNHNPNIIISFFKNFNNIKAR